MKLKPIPTRYINASSIKICILILDKLAPKMWNILRLFFLFSIKSNTIAEVPILITEKEIIATQENNLTYAAWLVAPFSNSANKL